MAKSHLPDATILRQLLRYEPDTGKLFWRERGTEWFSSSRFSLEVRARQWNSLFAGKEAFTSTTSHGYKASMLLGKEQKAHVVIWAMVHGQPPENDIDHINGKRADNRIENLRDVPRSINSRNTKLHKNNTSGQSGVWRVRKSGRWMAVLYVDKGRRHLGTFKRKADAIAARKKAEAEHGFTKRHGS